MVATLLSLKFHLVIAELRRSVARLILYIFLALYALTALAFLLLGLVAVSFVTKGHEALVGAIVVIAGSIIVVGWTVFPLLFFGFDQTLDPARFALFPLTGRKLAPGLILSGVLGIPGFLTAVVALGSALVWIRSPLVLPVGLVGGALGFLMTQICCRTASTALSGLLSTRKAKDLIGLISLIVILLLSMSGYAISIVSTLLAKSSGSLLSLATLERVGAVLAWTPFGAPWALAADASRGQWWLLLAHLVVAAIYLVAGLRLYAAVLDKALVTPAHVGSTALVRHDAIARAGGWTWAHGPLTPVAAIVARCLRYWRRDPRYLGQIPAVLMVLIIFVVIGATMPMLSSSSGEAAPALLSTGMIGFGLGFAALMIGYTLSADVASDASAWWIHLAAGVKGWQDRLGRIIAQAAWAVPLIVVAGVAAPLLLGSADRVPATLGAMFALYLSGAASSAIFSALIIYPVALPGESPLRMKTGMMGSQMLAQFGSLTAGGLLGLPVAILAIFARGWLGWLTLVVGLLWGAAALSAGVVFGGKIMDARGVNILQALIRNDSRERS